MASLVSGGALTWFLMPTSLVTETVTCLVSACELAWFLTWSLLVTLWPLLFQVVGWPGCIMLSSGNTYFGTSLLGGELLCFRS